MLEPLQIATPTYISPVGLAALAGLLLSGAAIRAQPVCSVDIGPDVVICQGESVVLHGPAGYGNYLWSTGETTPDITVSASGDYWCEVSYPSGNLVTNGDFSAGNTGFSSQYTYSLYSVQNEGFYTVGTDASWYHTQFQGTGNGNFLIANGGYGSWVNNQLDIWCQTIPCCPGQTYTLSFRGRTLTDALPARTVWNMDGVLAAWPDMTFPPYNAGWQQFNTTWTAGPGQTSVNACLHMTSGDGVGDDFGIDDINIAGTIVLRDTVHVSVTPLPVVDLGGDLTLCAGEAADFDASVPGGSYLWQDGSTSPTFHATAAGDYHVSVTANGCSNADTMALAFNTLPVVDLGPDTTLCAGATLDLSALAPGATYLWQDGSTGPDFTVSSPGTYWAEVTQNNCPARDSIIVGYTPLPVVDLGNDSTICSGEVLTLDAGIPGASYAWQDGSTGATLAVTASGSYDVVVSLNGCSAQDAVQVTVNPLPTVDLGPDQVVCPGSSATFDATTPGASYLWNDGSTAPTLSSSTPGDYSVEVTVNGCSASDTVALANFNLQSVNLGPDIAVCAGSSAMIGAAVPGATYAWSTGASSDSIPVSAAGTYWVEATLNGCAVRDSIEVAVTPLPVVDLGAAPQVCPGATATLDASTAGASYLWSNGATTPSITAGAGSWSVAVTVNACTANAAATITELTPPTADLGPDQVVCPGSSATFDATTPGASYLWNDGSTAPTLNSSTPGDYSVEVTVNGCSASDTVALANFNLQSVSLGPDIAVCAGSSAMIGAAVPGATYAWSTGASSDSIPVSAAGTYWVEATLNGCAVRDSIEVTVTPLPVVDLGPDLSLCSGNQLEFTVNAPSVLWDNGSTAPARTVDQGGTYWVLGSANGCTASDTITVNGLPTPAVELGPDTALCAAQQIDLDVTFPGGTYVWNDGSTAAQRTVGVGTWSVEVSAAGCSGSDSITISALPSPSLQLPPDTTLCAGETWPLDVAQPGSSYLWSTGASTPSITISSPGTYGVTVDRAGCVASAEVEVGYVDLSAFSLGPDTVLCPGSSLELTVDVPGATVLWQDGSTALQRSVSTAGAYQASISVGSCSTQAAVNIGFTPLPEADLGTDRSLCTGDSVWLAVTPGAAQVAWSTGASSDSLLVHTAGMYAVALALDGCTSTDTVHIAFHPVVDSLSLGPDPGICPGSTLVLDATIPGATYVWNDGSQGSALEVNAPGTYSVVATGPCIQATDTIVVHRGACVPDVHVPNAFTPDDDEINDLFVPVLVEPVRNWNFMVFDRWGERIFATDVPGDGWDGTVKGKDAPVGVYIWSLRYEAVTDAGVVQEQRRGSVTLVR